MRSLWEDEAPAFRGDHVAFEGVDAHPRPVQRPLPVVVGGHSRAAHRRAVQLAGGWYGFMLDRAATATQIESLRREAQSAGRDLEELTITVSPAERLEREVVRDFAKLGVDRLVLVPRPGLSLEDLDAYVRARAPASVGAEPAG
jgi:alkanesulfonate monooxygenase SsuD/methylene tetrahydromethanopterin reductase-like flavin-dependent oxidoreductase (luciferase family)